MRAPVASMHKPAVMIGGQRTALAPVALPARPRSVTSSVARRAGLGSGRTMPRVVCAAEPRPYLGEMLVNTVRQLDDDPYKEEALKQHRVDYNFADWRQHRRGGRYYRALVGMLTSKIIRGLRGPVIAQLLWSASIVLYNYAQTAGDLPEYMPGIPSSLNLPFSLSTFLLSVVLAYRTNSSYGRFQEARSYWAGMTSKNRELVRQAISWMDPVRDQERVDLVSRWMAAFSWAMVGHLRAKTEDDVPSRVKRILPAEQAELLLKAAHKPNTALIAVSNAVWQDPNLEWQYKIRMDENLTAYSDYIGASERILRTPIPVSYTRFTSRFMITWLVLLPICINNVAGPWTIPMSTALAFVLLAIEDIGVQLEEPFAVLPLESFAESMEADCMSLAKRGKLFESGSPMIRPELLANAEVPVPAGRRLW